LVNKPDIVNLPARISSFSPRKIADEKKHISNEVEEKYLINDSFEINSSLKEEQIKKLNVIDLTDLDTHKKLNFI
jgi:hypothetical protein